MSKITICTTTYNREHLLPRTVNSVLSQSFMDFDYLIINNGSTDNTQDIINNYCKKDSRIRTILFKENRKSIDLVNERFQLIKKNTALYYMIIDDDDFMEPNTVEKLFNLITKYNADIACVGSKHIFEDGTMRDKFVFDGIFIYNRVEAMIELLKREKFNAAIGAKLLKKETLNFPMPNVYPVRDIHTSYRRINTIQKMVVSGEPLYYFYRHNNNNSGLDSSENITPEKLKQHLEANKIRTEWLTEHMPEIKDYVFYCELSFMISLYERIYRLDVKDCFEIAEDMKKTLLCYKTFLSECGYLKESEKEIL